MQSDLRTNFGKSIGDWPRVSHSSVGCVGVCFEDRGENPPRAVPTISLISRTAKVISRNVSGRRGSRCMKSGRVSMFFMRNAERGRSRDKDEI